MNFRPYGGGIKGGTMKIYTQSESWLAKFSVDLSRGIVAAIVATVLLTTGVLVSGLVVFSGSVPAQ